MPVKTLDQIYKMYVRPNLDFCDVITSKLSNLFDSSSMLSNLLDQIERVQYQAALAVTGTWKGSSANKIYEELKIPVPSPRNHLFGTRFENDLHTINCRTNS